MSRRKLVNLTREIAAKRFEECSQSQALFVSKVRTDLQIRGISASSLIMSILINLAIKWFMEWLVSGEPSAVFTEEQWAEACKETQDIDDE